MTKKKTEGPISEAPAANQRLSDPEANWGRDAQKSEAESFLPTPEDEDRSWEGFLNFVSKKNKVVYSVLKEWECRRLEENLLEIRSGTHAFSSAYFDDPQHYDQLMAYGREFFDRDIRIKMIPGDANTKAPLPEPRPDKHKPLGNPDLPPTAHQILEMFEGRIVDPNGAGEKRP